jgi:hypothetical protein
MTASDFGAKGKGTGAPDGFRPRFDGGNRDGYRAQGRE